jgi:hypothetical protein
MEHTDWIHQGFDAAQARFLMVTAITHHRFSSPIWGEREVRKLHGELAEIGDRGFRSVGSSASASAMAPHLARIRRPSTRRSRRTRSSPPHPLHARLGGP